MPRGMTMIELIVALAVVAIALVVGGIAFGAVTGAEASQGAGEVSTAIRYTYNLSAINNKTYALFLDLDNGTYRVAPAIAYGMYLPEVSGSSRAFRLGIEATDNVQ